MPRFIDRIRKPSGTTAIVALLVAGVPWGINSIATAAEDELTVTLVAVNEAPATEGVQHTLLLSGHGTFTPSSVDASGTYTYLDAATEVPKTILSSGTWEATEVLKWTPAKGEATYASIHPGFVDLRVDLTPEEGPVIEGATLRINCNVPFAGIKNSDPDTGEPLAEGFWLTIPDGTAFGPTAAAGQFVPKDPNIGVTLISR
jgi:hypothetical protein